MARRHLPYQQVFDLLLHTPQNSNSELGAAADRVFNPGNLPRSAEPAA